jgi:hypothetical protein
MPRSRNGNTLLDGDQMKRNNSANDNAFYCALHS